MTAATFTTVVVAAAAAAVAAAHGQHGGGEQHGSHRHHGGGGGRPRRSTPTGANAQPIIGILTNPNDIPDPAYANATSYFASSYVKWLEAAGARVVPLLFDDPTGVAALLPYLNGALFTGGGTAFTYPNGTLTPFTQTAVLIFNEALNAWGTGEVWPLWGTCQGFELISFIASDFNMSTVNGPFNAENLSLPLDFTEAAAASTLYGSLPESVFNIFATEAVTMNNHQMGVTPANFAAAPALASRFTVLSTNVDRDSVPFVSSMEGVGGLPIFASQYHPEKIYEFDPAEGINHDFDAVLADGYLSLIFVQQVRQNLRAFPSQADAQAALIYNYAPAPTLAYTSFEQCYFFSPPGPTPARR